MKRESRRGGCSKGLGESCGGAFHSEGVWDGTGIHIVRLGRA